MAAKGKNRGNVVEIKEKIGFWEGEPAERQAFLVELEKLAKTAHEKRFHEFSVVLHTLLMSMLVPYGYLFSLMASCSALVRMMQAEIEKNKAQVH